MQRHCNAWKKRHGQRVLTTMDASKKRGRRWLCFKNELQNKLAFVYGMFLSFSALPATHSHSFSLSLSLPFAGYLVNVDAAVVVVVGIFRRFWPGSFIIEAKIFSSWKFMQQQINIVGMIINAFVSWAWVAQVEYRCLLFGVIRVLYS